jgi:nickel-type superoxide dismutase maturation protease
MIKVTGNSLSPILLPEDYVLVLTWPRLLDKLKKGDIIVFSHPVLGTLIKSISTVDPVDHQLEVEGFHPDSTNSKTLGPVPLSAVIGKVIWHIKGFR